ncbi:MAG TPA: folylpolyglutamate synthase/dihydrofolate synthase family protein [Dehalococcoidia bacterium]|jgi:dihydrofolate synthase/folylpolyglutamate synthase
MDFPQAEKYLCSFTDYEKVPGIAYTAANYDLRRMEILLQSLRNPHLGTKTVHIAGTKGKGSTAVLISQALVSAGYRVGLYTSPHLQTVTERIRIDGTRISDNDFASLVTEIKPMVESVNRQAAYGTLTTFEILTAVAFVHFKKNNIDFQVLEVGLGGRLDATNVVKPDVCVITSVSLDHTEILGGAVAKIAAEKAGIIKPGCTVIMAPQAAVAARVIKQSCLRQGANLTQVGKDVTWQKTGSGVYGQKFNVIAMKCNYELTIPLLGDYQLENAATAVAALEALVSTGARISSKDIREGFHKVSWPGRFQILNREPLVVADGAHNAYSMKKLVENINKYLSWKNCFVIFGTSSDKDTSGMAREIRTLRGHIIITSSEHPRAASIDTLSEIFSHAHVVPVKAATVDEALSRALEQAAKTDLVLITGSLFVAAEAIKYFEKVLLKSLSRS